MKNLFDFVKNDLLKGMPAGMLVTASPIDFDIGHWQHKPYFDNQNINHHLKQQWCSTIVNLFIFDETIRDDQIEKFADENDFEKHNRHIYLVYFIAIPKIKVFPSTEKILKYKSLNINRFSQKIEFGDYYIFVNDFIKHILLINE